MMYLQRGELEVLNRRPVRSKSAIANICQAIRADRNLSETGKRILCRMMRSAYKAVNR